MVFELTKKLCQTFGPSGRESLIADVIKEEIKDFVDEIYIDNIGNLIAHKKGDNKKVMVSAHMDSIGFVVSFIEDNGFLRFGNIGGLSVCDIINIPVVFKNGIKGVVSYREDKKISELRLSDMFIDIGAKNKEEALKLVKLGDFAVYANEHFTQNDIIVGPYMDNRISCAILIMAIKTASKTNNDVYYVFSAQEEVGLRGATVASYGINPDIGIAIDVTDTGDTPDKKDKMAVNLGEGPCVKIMDSSVICNSEIIELLKESAKKININTQDEVLRFGGTDTGAMQRSRNGALSGAISIGTRYIHSPSEMVSIKDVEESVLLLNQVILDIK